MVSTSRVLFSVSLGSTNFWPISILMINLKKQQQQQKNDRYAIVDWTHG